MTSIVKLAGLSAALAAAFVILTDAPSAESRTLAKAHYDRVAPEPEVRIQVAETSRGATATPVSATDGPGCRAAAWPYTSQDCGAADAGGVRRAVRTITIERREAPNTSTLVRVPAESR